MKKPNGYTLVELLITFAIFGIFLAIIIPAVGKGCSGRYLEEIQENAESHVADFNQFNTQRGNPWRMQLVRCLGDTDGDKYGSCPVRKFMECSVVDYDDKYNCQKSLPLEETLQCSIHEGKGCKGPKPNREARHAF